MAAVVPLAQQGLDPGKVTLIHNGIYKLVITLSAHDTGQRLQLKTSMKGVGQGKRQAKPWLQETTEETTTSMGSHPRGHQRKAAQCWPYQTHNPVNLPRQNVICFFSFFFSSVFFFFPLSQKREKMNSHQQFSTLSVRRSHLWGWPGVLIQAQNRASYLQVPLKYKQGSSS